MKIKHRILSICLAVVLLICTFSSVVQAAESCNDQNSDSTVMLNEFDLAAQFSKESEKALKDRGFSSSEIKKIKNYKEVFEKHIKKLSVIGIY
ncbi:MAG: hypothetical protein VZR02_00395 [Lachnospiraceae bacterium]|nr:hypothetical protein [Lachnospiraceae bacterium]